MAYDGRLLRLAQERYEADRTRREAELAAQREEIYARRPRLREIQEQLRRTASRVMAAALRRGQDPLPEIARLREENLGLQAERRQLLSELGLPEDALEDTPACPLCGDTGFRGGELCRCLKTYYVEEQRRANPADGKAPGAAPPHNRSSGSGTARRPGTRCLRTAGRPGCPPARPPAGPAPIKAAAAPPAGRDFPPAAARSPAAGPVPAAARRPSRGWPCGAAAPKFPQPGAAGIKFPPAGRQAPPPAGCGPPHSAPAPGAAAFRHMPCCPSLTRISTHRRSPGPAPCLPGACPRAERPPAYVVPPRATASEYRCSTPTSARGT